MRRGGGVFSRDTLRDCTDLGLLGILRRDFFGGMIERRCVVVVERQVGRELSTGYKSDVILILATISDVHRDPTTSNIKFKFNQPTRLANLCVFLRNAGVQMVQMVQEIQGSSWLSCACENMSAGCQSKRGGTKFTATPKQETQTTSKHC